VHRTDAPQTESITLAAHQIGHPDRLLAIASWESKAARDARECHRIAVFSRLYYFRESGLISPRPKNPIAPG
jgi:hypothetical protein